MIDKLLGFITYLHNHSAGLLDRLCILCLTLMLGIAIIGNFWAKLLMSIQFQLSK